VLPFNGDTREEPGGVVLIAFFDWIKDYENEEERDGLPNPFCAEIFIT